MKKSVKLLSVILAVLMIFSSLSVASFAAKAEYKTVSELEALNAYSPYGQVTRLSTEERLSIVFDELDNLLPSLNLNMGTVVDVMGITITIDLTSIDRVLVSFDSFKSSMSSTAWGIAKLFANLGLLEELSFSSWESGMSRDTTAHTTIVAEIMQLLSANTKAVTTVFEDGIDLGLINNMIPGFPDIRKSLNALISDIPGAVKQGVYPLFARPDDTATERGTYTNTSGNGGMASVLDSLITNLFAKPMNWTSYRVDSKGTDLGYTTSLPTAANTTSRYFEISADGNSITQYDYNYPVLLSTTGVENTWTKTVTYTKALENEGGTTYVFKAPADYEGDQTLKWYKSGDAGYLLPSVKKALDSGALSFSFNGDDSALTLLYKFIPYVFDEMAPVVLNGSVKKLLASAFDVEFTEMTGEEVKAAASATGDPDKFFTKEQGEYLWGYSDYKVIDGTPYYRYEDSYFVGTIPSNISTYYYMFNWDWNIGDGFIDKYIPKVSGSSISNSTAGYSSLISALNTFVYDVIDECLVDSFEIKGKTYDIKTGLGWQNGGLDKVVDNLIKAARYVFNMAPEEIFDEYYNDSNLSPYYNMMMNGTTKQALVGLVASIIELVMPQAMLPAEDKLCKTVGTDSAEDVSVAALAVVVLRELFTQLVPAYNFDALIYTDYSTKTLLTGSKYDTDYWVDTAVLMGIDLGMYYLRNITDLGEDSTVGYYGAMNALGVVPSSDASAYTYSAGATYVNSIPNWQYKVDWIIDWALTSTQEWAWGFEKLVDCGDTVDLATYQDPWKKLNTVLLKLLPLDEVFNDSGASSTSGTHLENVLREKLVNGLLNLDLSTVASILTVPDGLLKNSNVMTQLINVVRDLLNGIVYKVAGNYTLLDDATFSSLDAVLNQSNLKTLVVNLVGKLETATNNGLLVPIMPLANMFLGWKTGIQTYSEPSIYLSTASGDNYLHSEGTNVLRFYNASGGMLQKHRNSDKQDQSYVITVSNVEADADVSVSGFPCEVVPGATVELPITVPASDDVTKITVTYSYTGKDGKAIGGEQKKTIYARYASYWDQENDKYDANDKNYWQTDAYNKYVFTQNLYEDVTNYSASISHTYSSLGSTYTVDLQKVAYGTNPAANFSQYFTLNGTSSWSAVKMAKDDGPHNITGKLWSAASGVTEDTEMEYGYYDAGSVNFTCKTHTTVSATKSKSWDVDFIHYTDYGLAKALDKYLGYGLSASDYGVDAQEAYATYEEAIKDAVYLVYAPKTTSYIDDVMAYMEDTVTELENAYEALKAFKKVTVTTSVDTLIEALDAIETDKANDIDYQDHELYEYFQYENQRNAARTIIAAYEQPAKPGKSIEGEELSEAVITAIANASNSNLKTGINATLKDPDAQSLAAWEEAVAAWTAPTYSSLQMDDQIALLKYYFSFMDANWRSTVVKDYLKQEIEVAEGKNYVQSAYSTDSWAAYADALANAKAVYNDTKAHQSDVFDAKYALMKAQNDLIPAYASMKDDGYLDGELSTLISQANAVVNHFNDYFRVADGVNATDAWKELVKALGVEYDVTVDGIDYEGILYSRSALTYKAYDRLNTNKEKAKVDAACDKLQAALNNFVSSVTVDKSGSGVVNQVEQTVRYIQGITPGSITSAEGLLANIKASNSAAKLSVVASKANAYGTGAKVDVSVDGVGVLTTYYVVIYGDVNGDGAVDAFDAFYVDKDINNISTLDGVYSKAADTDASGSVTIADMSAIMSAAVGNADAISQVK